MAGISHPSFEDKRRVLELLNVHITVKGGRAAVTCHIPTQPEHIDFSTFRSKIARAKPSSSWT